MKKQICLILGLIALLFLGSCQKYIGTLEVQKGMKKIGIANPVINLRVSEYSKPTGMKILNKKKVLRSIPKELLIDSEKDFLNKLVERSISICEENLSSKFIEIESSKLKSDFKNILDEVNVTQIQSNGLINRDQIFSELPNKKDKLLTYIIMSDIKSNSLKPHINDKSGEHKLIIKKAKYDNFNVINETKKETLVKFNNYNYLYTKNNQSSIDVNDKSKITEACFNNNLDALISINLNYQFERTADILSLDYKWRIRLRGEIKIYNNKGILVNENAITGKSNYLKITKAEFNKISNTTQFVYNLENLNSDNTKIDIFEVMPRTEYSFSLQNIFGSLYVEATENFLLKLATLD